MAHLSLSFELTGLHQDQFIDIVQQRTMAGKLRTRDGKHGDHVLLAPPFILEEAQVSELVDKLGTALAAATQHA